MNIKQIAKELCRYIKGNYQLPVVEKQVYSEAETVIGVWKDGKPLYRKVIEISNPTTNNTNGTTIDVSDLSIDSVSVLTGEYIRESGSERALLYYFMNSTESSSRSSFLRYDKYINSIFYKIIEPDSVSKATIILEYTKTTDTPEQSKVPFEPLVEYSTEEKLIGYWIDGKPLYRKVIDCGALPNNSTKLINHNIEDLMEVISVEGISIHGSYPGNSIPLPFYTVNNTGVGLFVATGQIQINTGRNLSEYSKTFVTIKYTKTTD